LQPDHMPLSLEAQEAVELDYARTSRLHNDIQSFLYPESGVTPGGEELIHALQDFAQRVGVPVEDEVHPLDQIVVLSRIVKLELQRLEKQR